MLDKIPVTLTVEEAVRIGSGVLTTGADRFGEAEKMVSSGRRDEAVACFRELMREFPESWLDRASRQRLEALEST